MTTEEHKQFATHLTLVQYCGQKGLMDLDTASRGLTYITGYASQHSVDEYYMETLTKKLKEGPSPSAENCNAAAMDILARKRLINQNNASVEASQQEMQQLANSLSQLGQQMQNSGQQMLNSVLLSNKIN